MAPRDVPPAADASGPLHLAIRQVASIKGQMRLINGIFAALNSSMEVADLQLMLLTILTTPRGLGFTRAHLFVAADKPRKCVGKMAIGCGSAAELAAMESEIQAEEALLATMAESGRARGPRGGMADELHDLRSQTWWITAFQRADADNPLTEQIRDRNLFKPRLRTTPRLMAGVGEVRTVHVRGDSRPRTIDPEIDALLGDEYLLAPLRTKGGVKAVVATDKSYQPEGITADDEANFDWLCNQASLALENAELYDDLKRAYGEIEAVDQMKSNFLSTISHELRTPLTSILGFVQLILTGKIGEITPNIHRLLEKVVDKSRDLHTMVNDILEIAEIQAGGLVRLEPEPVEVLPIVDHVLERLAQRRRLADVEIEHHRPADPLPPVLGDVQALERIFYHIIDNAIKFIPISGKVIIRHRATSRHVEVAVRDTGIGIAPEHLERIFDHFYQVDSELNRSYNGIGLGLTITRRLIDLLSANVHVQSRPGKGTTIRVGFPIAPENGSDR